MRGLQTIYRAVVIDRDNALAFQNFPALNQAKRWLMF